MIAERLRKPLSYALLCAAPWIAVLSWDRYDRHRSAQREVSTGIYLGMIEEARENPRSIGMIRAALADGRIDNGEALPIMDEAGVFTIPKADHWNPRAQARARHDLEKYLSDPNHAGRTSG